MLRSLLPIVLAFGFVQGGIAQNIKADASRPQADATAPAAHLELGHAAFPLNGPWKFTVGDSPVDAKTGGLLWAEPGFDDSHWENVDLTPPEGSTEYTSGLSGFVPGWTTKGHPGYSGFAWYRIRVQMEGQEGRKLALQGPTVIDDAYQAYANGALLGSLGDFSGKTPVEPSAQPMLFTLPSSSKTGVSEVIAFRVWMSAATLIDQDDAGGMHSAPVLGEAATVSNGYTMIWLQFAQEAIVPDVVLAAFSLIVAGIAFALFLFDRTDRLYPWIGTVYLLTVLYYGFTAVGLSTQLISFPADFFLNDCLLGSLLSMGWVMVWWIWFGRPKPRWIPQAAVALCVLLVLSRGLSRSFAFEQLPHSFMHAAEQTSLVMRALFAVMTLWIAILGIRKQGLEGWLVLPVVLLRGVTVYSWELIEARLLPTAVSIFGQRIPISIPVFVLTFVALMALLLRRLLFSVREQRQMALDVKQAQEVQQMIVPEAVVSYPGLDIETVYRPAREVGGDFFQILPHPCDGSLLIVAGDVAGKGLQAGMLVALLVGAIRTALESSYDPGHLISVLNRRLVGRAQGATTCLALLISADGAVKLANAGHVPPYLNGKQLPMEGALPLGIFEGAECSVMRFQLEPEDSLVLMSDGILEAMNPRGELFGFERIADLLGRKANAVEVAEAAQRFGQEDDISVIAVTRTLEGVLV
jgi:hypothetical protein